MSPVAKPEGSEAPEYYFTYIDLVGPGDVRVTLERQLQEALTFLRAIPPSMSRHRYAEGKWTIGEVVCHLNDTERVFASRAFWFARGFDAPLPGFSQDDAVAMAAVDERDWDGLVSEFEAVRLATISLYRWLPLEAWDRRGTANERVFTVRALAHATAGHVTHHLRLLTELYLAT